MCWVMPPASPATTSVSRIASSSEVLPWSTWPMIVTTGGRSIRSSSASSNDGLDLDVVGGVDDLDLLLELVGEHLDRVVGERLRERRHLAQRHQLLDDLGHRHAEVLGDVLDGRAGVDADQVGGLHRGVCRSARSCRRRCRGGGVRAAAGAAAGWRGRPAGGARPASRSRRAGDRPGRCRRACARRCASRASGARAPLRPRRPPRAGGRPGARRCAGGGRRCGAPAVAAAAGGAGAALALGAARSGLPSGGRGGARRRARRASAASAAPARRRARSRCGAGAALCRAGAAVGARRGAGAERLQRGGLLDGGGGGLGLDAGSRAASRAAPCSRARAPWRSRVRASCSSLNGR